MSLTLLIVAVATASPGHAARAVETNPDPHVEDIPLRFGWPAGMGCEVAVTDVYTTAGASDRAMSGTYHVDVSAHPEGLQLHSELTAFQATGGTSTSAASLARAAYTMPDRVIAPDGQFRRLENLPPYNASVTALLQPLLASADTAPAAQALLTRLSDVPALQSTLAAAWRRSIGFWPGLTLIPRADVSSFAEDEVPFVPGTSLRWNYTTLLVETTGCDAADTAKRCVKLEYTGTPPSRPLHTALVQSGATLLAGDPAVSLNWSAARASVHTVLVVEPDTLIPHSEVQVRTLYAEVRPAGGPTQVIDRSERLERASVCTLPPRS